MRRLSVGLLLGVMFLVFGAFNSYADEMCGCMGKMGEGMHAMEGMKHRGMWGHLKDLGLDDTQKETIKEIGSRVAKDTIRQKADIQVARIELRDILHKDPVDMKAAEAKLKQLEALRTDLHLSHIKTMEEVKAKLTPEQRKKFMENLKKRKGFKHGRKGLLRHEEEKE